jgi:hypothetical protein
MAGKQLDKQISKALEDTERWLQRQPSWKNGNLSNASGSVISHRGPAVLSEADCVLQFARFLNKHGVPWKDMHIEVTPAQWLVDPGGGVGARPRRIDLAIVERDRLAKRTAPFSPAKDKDFLFDAIFEFKLASNNWVRTLKNGKPAQPPKRVGSTIQSDVAKMGTYLRDLWASRGYVVIIEEADHGWERPATGSVDGLSVHYLKCF